MALPNGLIEIQLGATTWREIINQNFSDVYTQTQIDNMLSAITVDASGVSLDVTNFNNNLDNTITDVQILAEFIDDLNLSGAVVIDDLTDVDTTTVVPDLNEVLGWDGTNWTPRAVAAGSVNSLNDILDVNVPTPTDGYVLAWDTTTAKWIAVAPSAGGGAVTIDDLTDVDTTTTAPVLLDVLQWDGTNWIPGTISAGGGGAIEVFGTNYKLNDDSLIAIVDTSALNNYMYGVGSGNGISTGDYNIGIGFNAINSLNVFQSTAIGHESMKIGASYSVAVGYRSLYSGAGSYNVAVGHSALYKSTNNTRCTAIGYKAMYESLTDFDNVAIGNSALQNTAGGDGNVAIGYQAMIYNTTSNNNTAVGKTALQNNLTGFNNAALGYNAGRYLTDGTNNTTVDNCSFIGQGSRASADNQVQLGDSTTTTYAYGAVQDRSDERDKTEIRDTVLGLEFITKIRAVDFKWDRRDDYFETVIEEIDGEEVSKLVPIEKDGSKAGNRFHNGVIAQEIKQVCDELGVDFGGYQDHSLNGGNDILSIGYTEFISPLIKAVQELKIEKDKEISDLQKQIDEIKSLID